MFTHEESGRKQCCADVVNCCSGAECMGWRWVKKRGDGPIRIIAMPPGAAPELPKSDLTRWYAGDKNEDGTVNWGEFPRLGYCGLAGDPE